MISLKLKNFDNLLFMLISCVIFISAGNFIDDFKRLIVLKILIILLILFKINIYKEVKNTLNKYKLISVIFLLFIISITISLVSSSSDISQFAYIWLRIRYLHTITDIFLYLSFYFYFKNTNINFSNLIKSIIIPGVIFSLFVIFKYIKNHGLSNSNEQIIFFDGIRMVGMLLTFLIVFYLGCMHNLFENKKTFQNTFVLTTFLTLILLLQGRGAIISILLTYFCTCIILSIKGKNIKNGILTFIFCVFVSFLIFFIINNSILEINSLRSKDSLLMTNDRIDLWKYGYYLFLENPLFGKGPGGFIVSVYNDFVSNKSYGDMIVTQSMVHTQPHNFIVQFLVEWGIAGTSLIFFLFLRLLFVSMRFIFLYKNHQLLISGMSIFALISHGFVDGALFHAILTFYLILCLGILCSEIDKKILD